PKIHAPFLALPPARLPPLTAPDQRPQRPTRKRLSPVCSRAVTGPAHRADELGHQGRAIDAKEADGKPTPTHGASAPARPGHTHDHREQPRRSRVVAPPSRRAAPPRGR